jgi:predicted RNA methylase
MQLDAPAARPIYLCLGFLLPGVPGLSAGEGCSQVTLNPHTVLRRAPELKLRLDSSNYTFIETAAGTIEGGIHGLAVINAFAAPITVAEAVGNLSAGSSGLQDWIGLTSTIVKLHEAGILLRPDAAQPSLKRTTSGFDAARIHVQMLDDRARTASYLAAIAAVVKPDDVVVDIGTGTGILALAAARAGARRVYAVEASSMGTVAEQLFRANGLSDRVTLVPGWSTQIELPELADVLISEVIGNDPLGEQVLEITADARRRLVKPDARLIPHQMKIHGVAVSIPESELARRTFRAQAAQAWQDWYSFNFQPLVDIARHAELTFFVRPHTVKAWPRLSGPFELAEVRRAHGTPTRRAYRAR